jgi:hypothetical protein
MPKRRDFLEKLSEDDPNYEIGKRFYLEAWADSHGLVADAFAGKASLADLVDGCVKSVEQGARTQVAIQNAETIPSRLRELDVMVEKSIRLVGNSLQAHSKRFGKTRVKAAIAEFSRRVNEVAARSKQQILESELARSADRTAGRSPAIAGSPKLSAVEEKTVRTKLLQSLKLCWPKIFPENARIAALDHSALVPAFCSYAQDLFDGYMRASDLTEMDFWPHVEAIQTTIIQRIAPEPMMGLSWGVQIGGLEAVVEWTRKGWLAKINAQGKWIWRQPVADLESGKSIVFDEAAMRAGLKPPDVESMRRELSWQDRG